MSATSDPISVLVDVQPRLLGSALATMLRRMNRSVTMTEPTGGHTLSRRYRVAVVSDVMPDGVEAEVVIRLPRDGRTTGSCRTRGEDRSVMIRRPRDVAALVAELDLA